MKQLWLYWVGDVLRDKIGISKDFVKRMQDINNSVPFDVSIFDAALLPESTARKAEKDFCREMRPWRLKGEWFSFDKEGMRRAAHFFDELRIFDISEIFNDEDLRVHPLF